MGVWSSIIEALNGLSLVIAPVFYQLLFMSIGASCIGFMLLLLRRFADDRIPPIWKYWLWLFLLLALIFPYRPSSQLAVVPPIRSTAVPFIQDQTLLQPANPSLPQPLAFDSNSDQKATANLSESKNSFLTKLLLLDVLLPVVWLLGIVILLIFLFVGHRRLWHQIKLSAAESKSSYPQVLTDCSILLEECRQSLGINQQIDLFLQDKLRSPAVIGLFQPKIILPCYIKDMEKASIRHILYHELGHLKRKDLILNQLLLLLQTIYWFNPIIWFLFKRIRQDMEVLNDQYVLRHIGLRQRSSYSKALVEVLAYSHGIPVLPRLLCLVDNNHHTKRRIKLLQQFEKFKAHRLVIAVLCFIGIGLLSLFFLTSKQSPKTHQIAFYVGQGMDLTSEQVQAIIEQSDPVLTETDIKAYNPETHMFFLKENILAHYQQAKKSAQPSFIKGGSLILNSTGNDSFILTVNGQIAYQGHFNRPLIVSYIPSNPILVDADQGILLTTNHRTLADQVEPSALLTTALKEMDLLTDQVFSLPVINSPNIRYDTKALWQFRTPYIGKNWAIGNMISGLIFPKGMTYDHFELQTQDQPYGVQIHLNSTSAQKAFLAESANQDLFLQNALILFSLIENAGQVQFVLTNDTAPPLTISYDTAQATHSLGTNYYRKTEQLIGFYNLIETYYRFAELKTTNSPD